MRIALIACLTIAAGCTRHTRRLPGMGLSQPLSVDPLTRDDYVLLDPVEGRACHSVVSLFPIPIWWTMGEPHRASAQFSGARDPSAGAALYKAIEKEDQADAVISPVWHVERKSVMPWYVKTCTDVRARAIRLKTDEERAADHAGQGSPDAG